MLYHLVIFDWQFYTAVHKEDIARSIVALCQSVEEHGHQRSAQLFGAVADEVFTNEQRPVFWFCGFFAAGSGCALSGEGNMKIAILGLNLSLVALAFSKALEVLNGNLVVNSNNEGGVAGINFLFCKDHRHWTSFAQSIYKLIHNKYSFLSVLTVDLSILFFNRIFKNIDNISRKSSSDRFSQSKKIFFQCSKF